MKSVPLTWSQSLPFPLEEALRQYTEKGDWDNDPLLSEWHLCIMKGVLDDLPLLAQNFRLMNDAWPKSQYSQSVAPGVDVLLWVKDEWMKGVLRLFDLSCMKASTCNTKLKDTREAHSLLLLLTAALPSNWAQ